mmetsp:Transcript_29183/g.89395  ORF Transcript_29183/g.89395 Transcript_29183/m.89395 type:complete len:155 (-) Transcript_29183:322-786(-)
MCFELIAVLNTTLLSMMGPGLALRGPDGSMHPAVDGMMKEYRTAYFCFVLGLLFFHFSAALFAWLIYVHWAVSMMVTLCICGSLWLLTRYAKRVYIRFRLPPELIITGKFNSDEVAAAAGPMATRSGKSCGPGMIVGVSSDQAQLIAAANQSDT